MAGATGAQRGVRTTKVERRNMLRGKRDVFLAHLAANCNVEAAANAVKVPASTIFRWRRMEPDFAANWAEAIAQGYQMLEARLIAHALAGNGGETLDGVAGTPVAPLNVDLAIRVMGLQRHGASKGFPGAPRQRVSREDAMTVLLERLEMIEARKRADAARLAAPPAPVLIEQRRGGEGA